MSVYFQSAKPPVQQLSTGVASDAVGDFVVSTIASGASTAASAFGTPIAGAGVAAGIKAVAGLGGPQGTVTAAALPQHVDFIATKATHGSTVRNPVTGAVLPLASIGWTKSGQATGVGQVQSVGGKNQVASPVTVAAVGAVNVGGPKPLPGPSKGPGLSLAAKIAPVAGGVLGFLVGGPVGAAGGLVGGAWVGKKVG